MKFPRSTLAFFLIAATAHTAFPSANWGQVRPIVDPDLSSYASHDSASGILTIAASEEMQLLVHAWANDLLHRHPHVKVAVSPTSSTAEFTPLLARRAEVLAMSRRMTSGEHTEFVLEYGYEPTEVPVAGTTLGALIHKANSITGLSRDAAAAAQAAPIASVNVGGIVEPWRYTTMSDSGMIQRRRYLYVATPPHALPSQAASELVRYALSKQGQQLVLDLGHVPLSSAEIQRAAPRWSACCQIH